MSMVQYKMIDRRRPAMQVFENAITPLIRQARDQFFRMVVDEVVQLSPVDTGTYMDAHHLSVGPSRAALESSHRKDRNQPWGPRAEAALSRLYSQIEALPDSVEGVRLANNAAHASFVEYGGASGGGGYAPYQSAFNRFRSGGEM
jgi:hypothetical protein